MKKFQFLLLDTGPVLELLKLELWNKLTESCDVYMTPAIVDEVIKLNFEYTDQKVNLTSSSQLNVTILDVELPLIKSFLGLFDSTYQGSIHREGETLAFLWNKPEKWLLCSADSAVFRVLGLLGKAEQGISLEEILEQIGLKQNLGWQYSRKFREKYTQMGQVDLIQNKGLKK
jgi:hypothetical protein